MNELEYPQLDRAAKNGAIDAINGCIAIVQQSLDTVRYEIERAEEDAPPGRTVNRTGITAREHVIALLTGYRDRVDRDGL